MTKINTRSLLTNIFPEIIINRTFNKLPSKLKTHYLKHQQSGNQVAIGLDVKLGFYLIKHSEVGKVELVWWENQDLKVHIA